MTEADLIVRLATRVRLTQRDPDGMSHGGPMARKDAPHA
jgi:hypothetical protein